MTIKQQGGIFGRNPTFNDVTVEGTLTTSGAQSVEELNVDNINIDGNTISSTNTNGDITIDPDGTGDVVLNSNVGIGSSAVSNRLSVITASADSVAANIGGIMYGGNYRGLQISTFTNLGGADTGVEFNAAPTTLGYGRFKFANNTKELCSITEAGNIAFPSGQGIDFSATSDAAGSSSELLDDYEEGTWTPILDGSGGASGQAYSSQTGYYTKIGDTVFVTGYVQLSTEGTVSGWARLGNLPYTPSKNGAGVASYIANMSVTDGLFLDVRTDGNVYLHTQDVTAILGSTLFTNTSAMKFSLTYKV